jgi:hypothetical protein
MDNSSNTFESVWTTLQEFGVGIEQQRAETDQRRAETDGSDLPQRVLRKPQTLNICKHFSYSNNHLITIHNYISPMKK